MQLFKKQEDTFDYTLDRICLTCQKKFAGRYCPVCGEKVVEPSDRSFIHFVSGVLNAFTFFETKFYKSVKVIIFDPGKFSTDITRGFRQPYMKPVSLFFLANFIYFLFPFFQTFNTSLYAQMNNMPYKDWASDVVASHLATTGLDLETLRQAYDQSSTGWSKLLLILLVPYIFPFVALVNYSKKSYLSDHFMFSMEYMTYLLYVPTIFLSTLFFFMVKIGRLANINLNFWVHDTYIIPLVSILLLYFLIRSIGTFYQFSWWRRLLSSALLLIAMKFVIDAYHFTLFFITIKDL